MTNQKVSAVIRPTTSSCLMSAPAIKSITPAVTTIRIAVEISGCSTIKTDTIPMSTPKGSSPARASRIRRPLLVNQALT